MCFIRGRGGTCIKKGHMPIRILSQTSYSSSTVKNQGNLIRSISSHPSCRLHLHHPVLSHLPFLHHGNSVRTTTDNRLQSLCLIASLEPRKQALLPPTQRTRSHFEIEPQPGAARWDVKAPVFSAYVAKNVFPIRFNIDLSHTRLQPLHVDRIYTKEYHDP